MNRVIAGLIGSVILAGPSLGTALASGDEYYEHNELREHGKIYLNYHDSRVSYVYMNYDHPYVGYHEDDRHGYAHDRYKHGRIYNTDIFYPNKNVDSNVVYRNHELHEYRR